MYDKTSILQGKEIAALYKLYFSVICMCHIEDEYFVIGIVGGNSGSYIPS